MGIHIQQRIPTVSIVVHRIHLQVALCVLKLLCNKVKCQPFATDTDCKCILIPLKEAEVVRQGGGGLSTSASGENMELPVRI